MTSSETDVFLQVSAERARQRTLAAEGRFAYTIADPRLTDLERLAILLEEVGEVAHEITETIGKVDAIDRPRLHKELVQVAAVATGWLEELRGWNVT